jgi:hypothetical protein
MLKKSISLLVALGTILAPEIAMAQTSSPAPETAPSTTDLSSVAEEEMVAEDPVPDTSEVSAVEREESYSDDSLDHKVARALYEQGYFSGEDQDSKESFIKALKNFQTLSGIPPTGEITPEVLQKLGVGGDQFSPE